MKTRWTENVTAENAWSEYPRPQFVRKNWMNLNGTWEYAVRKKYHPRPDRYQGDILVPFCIESALSGVQRTIEPGDRIWYRRLFEIPTDWHGKKVMLHFEAADYAASVWINGAVVGSHRGAYDRFSFDVTDYIARSRSCELDVCVDDPTSFGPQPRGKQQSVQQRIWYTPVSGIWQTVWLEPVSTEAHLQEVRITPDIDTETVSIIPMLNKALRPGYKVEVRVSYKGHEIAAAECLADSEVVLDMPEPRLWSPDEPVLYDLALTLMNPQGEIIDEVASYFGMRKISLGYVGGNKRLFLNNKPLFHYGTLDQGWWPDGLHTPPSDEAMQYDIEITKKMGFNMIRKHIKVEPDRWYYHCDRLGILVWQDMSSGMVVIPEEGQEQPVHVQHVPRGGADLQVRSEDAAQFEWELRRMIDIHYNSPAIVVWVPFNEGWGQYATCRIAEAVKRLDPSRLVNAVSGWALRPCGDIYDIHSYQVEVDVPPVSIDMACAVGEYGGIGFPIEDHLSHIPDQIHKK